MGFPLSRRLFRHYVGQVSVPQGHSRRERYIEFKLASSFSSHYIPCGVSDCKTHACILPPAELALCDAVLNTAGQQSHFVFLMVQRKGKLPRCNIYSLDSYEALVRETIILEM